MAVGIEGKIFNALADAVDLYVSINPIAVAYPGIAFVPSTGAPYLRPWLLPAPSISTDWARSNDYSGIFQIDLFWPAVSGIKQPMAVAAVIVDFFSGGRFVSNDIVVNINDPPYLSPAQQEPGWLQIPINVRYRALASASGVILSALASVESQDIAAMSGTVT